MSTCQKSEEPMPTNLSLRRRKTDTTRKRILNFDPTVHAGHVMTALTIIACSLGAWYDMKSSLAVLKEDNARQEMRIDKVEMENKEKYKEMQENLATIAMLQREEVSKLRDNMNEWFLRLGDKIERKVDKNGK